HRFQHGGSVQSIENNTFRTAERLNVRRRILKIKPVDDTDLQEREQRRGGDAIDDGEIQEHEGLRRSAAAEQNDDLSDYDCTQIDRHEWHEPAANPPAPLIQ